MSHRGVGTDDLTDNALMMARSARLAHLLVANWVAPARAWQDTGVAMGDQGAVRSS